MTYKPVYCIMGNLARFNPVIFQKFTNFSNLPILLTFKDNIHTPHSKSLNGGRFTNTSDHSYGLFVLVYALMAWESIDILSMIQFWECHMYTVQQRRPLTNHPRHDSSNAFGQLEHVSDAGWIQQLVGYLPLSNYYG